MEHTQLSTSKVSIFLHSVANSKRLNSHLDECPVGCLFSSSTALLAPIEWSPLAYKVDALFMGKTYLRNLYKNIFHTSFPTFLVFKGLRFGKGRLQRQQNEATHLKCKVQTFCLRRKSRKQRSLKLISILLSWPELYSQRLWMFFTTSEHGVVIPYPQFHFPWFQLPVVNHGTKILHGKF